MCKIMCYALGILNYRKKRITFKNHVFKQSMCPAIRTVLNVKKSETRTRQVFVRNRFLGKRIGIADVLYFMDSYF